MNWATIQNAVQAWFTSATGIVTIWADQNAPRPAYPFAVLNVISETALGQDEVRYTLNAATGKLDPVVCGNRLLTVSCQVHTRTPAPNTSPRHYLSLARTSLKKSTVLDALKIAGLAVVRAESVQINDQDVEGAWVYVGLMDIQFAAADNVADTSSDYIETVQATGEFPPSDLTINGPWGNGV